MKKWYAATLLVASICTGYVLSASTSDNSQEQENIICESVGCPGGPAMCAELEWVLTFEPPSVPFPFQLIIPIHCYEDLQ
jgi:hypothetical protein